MSNVFVIDTNLKPCNPVHPGRLRLSKNNRKEESAFLCRLKTTVPCAKNIMEDDDYFMTMAEQYEQSCKDMRNSHDNIRSEIHDISKKQADINKMRQAINLLQAHQVGHDRRLLKLEMGPIA